ncbi:glucose-6-phosphate isomerase [Wenzhouxiangella sp. XN79A]|uniref:glucose-6-phosphate isomerase n=1 Tax=Wenzhouxiangella sp. XN79A TaxID=2724193 RepID=UPI00144ABB91|nr:glucose-6-phosphate isomerase [Wenzhouxiangella sp. XN79A]NKI35460.1 glucose-6-phosphate isomerase [Wenzhouxiangella sp. XN79A]
MSQKNNTNRTLAARLDAEPDRMAAFATTTARWRLDAGLTPIDAEVWQAPVPGRRDAVEALLRGRIVNLSEQRPALHAWLRGAEGEIPEAFARARERMLSLADRLYRGESPIRDLIHIGIGGSDLGPRLVAEALDPGDSAVRVHWRSTLDARGLERLLGELEPTRTGLVVASKSFGTRETRLQAEAVRSWLGEAWAERTWAATARSDRARDWGLSSEHVLPFDGAIGGRFSLWSPVGISAAARIGRARFEALLEGARTADLDLRRDPDASLAGRLACAVDQLTRVHGFATLGVVAYAPGLRRLADYLQQLVMESLGKRVTADGAPAEGPSSPLIFGGAGTDLQHSIFQAVHQGRQRHPMLLVGNALNSADHDSFCIEQAANLLGQARTLALGHRDEDPQRVLPGGNPVLMLWARPLDAAAVGELLAHWEHAVYLLGTAWNLNPFDQWGVEEGKRQAEAVRPAIEKGGEPPDERFRALLDWLRAGAGRTRG